MELNTFGVETWRGNKPKTPKLFLSHSKESQKKGLIKGSGATFVSF
jgi:hypothetical protein